MENKKITLWLGLIIFIISQVVYLITLEPTNSYWDCSEFIACAYKLEIGHAPGAPVFMLLGRFFSLFAGGDVSKVALMINALSATTSSLTIVFLFLILLWFVKKTEVKSFSEYPERTKLFIIYGAAFIGAITYAFTDSFWFSAVEGEVYATSSLFSAIVFWGILKWEETKEEGWQQTRWIYLIFFLLGLSVGIHLLNMLALPAIALVYYIKNYKITTKGIISSQLVALFILVLFIFVVIPGVAKYAAFSDLLFVNSFNLPVYSGALTALIFLVVGLRYTYIYFNKKRKQTAKIALIAISFWLAGYSSFAVLVIRSNSNPFIDMNNVENVFGLVDYLNREQYPTRPLFKGNSYNSPIISTNKRYTYKLHNGRYYKDELNPEYVFDKNTLSLFPRMASLSPGHEEYYKNWVEIKGRKVKIKNAQGITETIVVPTLSDNIRFFIRYQLGHMYFRYFMWNFAGRQDDIQGHGDRFHGNWISGISLLDSIRLGDQDILPDKYKKHKSRNTYYLLPLVLGLLGIFFQYKKDKYNFWVVLLLFFYTGIAIVIYLNEIPITPRERDYVYVGSFFAFCIWIGMGVLAIVYYLRKILKRTFTVLLLMAVLAALVPVNMLVENWNDHNRADRRIAHDLAMNTLNILAPNAILVTNGDNDTYPIWYVQEVENFRPDVRHILQTFLPIDWYADQLLQKHPDKGNIPISLTGEELLMSRNNYFPIFEKIDSAIDLKGAIGFIANTDKRTKVRLSNGSEVNYLPSRNLYLKVNAENFIETCTYVNESETEIPSKLSFTIKKKYLSRDDFLILDILSKNDWKRPIYFMNPQALNSIGLGDYLHQEGNVYRLLPFKKKLPGNVGRNQALVQYNIIKKSFKWGNIAEKDIFLDYYSLHMINSLRYNQMFAKVATQLLQAEEYEKAVEMLDTAMQVLPVNKVGFSVTIPSIARAYYQLNEKAKADKLVEDIFESYTELFQYYLQLGLSKSEIKTNRDLNLGMYICREVLSISQKYAPGITNKYLDEFNLYYTKFYAQ